MSADQLLKGAGELSLPDLDHFVSRVIRLRAERSAPSLPLEESELLARINQGVSAPLRQRYDEFLLKRDTATLADDEQEELKSLSLKVETLEAERIHNLILLAELRCTTLPALMQSLGLRTPEYA